MKSSQGLVKFVISCWTRPRTTSGYSKEKWSKWPWSSRPVRKIHFKAYIIHWHGPMNFAVGAAKHVFFYKKGKGLWQRIIFMIIFHKLFLGEEKMKTREDKRMVRLELFFKTTLFRTYIQKISTFTFWCMAIRLGAHWVYTNWGAQRLANCFFKNSNMKLDHEVR